MANERVKRATKRIKEKMKPKPLRKRGAVTLYLDTDLFRVFKKECEEANSSASLLLEDFMREFLDGK